MEIKKSVFDSWVQWLEMALPPDASDRELRLTKGAYYCGAGMMMQMVGKMLIDHVPAKVFADTMNAFADEIKVYMNAPH